MTATERLAELQGHLEHLGRLCRKGVPDKEKLRSDRSLHNDVLFSLLMACQAVIDVAGDIASRHGLRFQDYTEAVRALRDVDGFAPELVGTLERLPGFRNVLIHEYADLDYDVVIDALGKLASLREFVALAATELAVDRD